MGDGVRGVEIDRLPEELHPPIDVVLCDLEVGVAPPEHQLVGIEVLGRYGGEPGLPVRGELRLEHPRDTLGQVALHREDVPQLPAPSAAND